jgi:hypothetical protein
MLPRILDMQELQFTPPCFSSLRPAVLFPSHSQHYASVLSTRQLLHTYSCSVTPLALSLRSPSSERGSPCLLLRLSVSFHPFFCLFFLLASRLSAPVSADIRKDSLPFASHPPRTVVTLTLGAGPLGVGLGLESRLSGLGSGCDFILPLPFPLTLEPSFLCIP